MGVCESWSSNPARAGSLEDDEAVLLLAHGELHLPAAGVSIISSLVSESGVS